MDTLGQLLRAIGFVGTILGGFMLVVIGYLILFQGFVPALIPAVLVVGTFVASIGAVYLGKHLKDDE
jgi:CHASE2 domain-containing sensor protein